MRQKPEPLVLLFARTVKTAADHDEPRLKSDRGKAGRLAGDIERLKGGTSTLLPALEQEHAAVLARITQAVGTGKKRRTS